MLSVPGRWAKRGLWGFLFAKYKLREIYSFTPHPLPVKVIVHGPYVVLQWKSDELHSSPGG